MKRYLLVLGVVALLTIAVALIGAANGASASQELRIDALVTEITPGPGGSINLGKGEAEYVELALYEGGDVGGGVSPACEHRLRADGCRGGGIPRLRQRRRGPGAGRIVVDVDDVEGVVEGVVYPACEHCLRADGRRGEVISRL